MINNLNKEKFIVLQGISKSRSIGLENNVYHTSGYAYLESSYSGRRCFVLEFNILERNKLMSPRLTGKMVFPIDIQLENREITNFKLFLKKQYATQYAGDLLRVNRVSLFIKNWNFVRETILT